MPPATAPAVDPSYLSPRDRQRLDSLDPEFRAPAMRVLKDMHAAGHPMFITSARRTVAQQQALWRQGRSEPGRIVTWVDGVQKLSNHQSGRAMDCAFVAADIWDGPWELYGTVAERHGLAWGGRWLGKKCDRPHVELSR